MDGSALACTCLSKPSGCRTSLISRRQNWHFLAVRVCMWTRAPPSDRSTKRGCPVWWLMEPAVHTQLSCTLYARRRVPLLQYRTSTGIFHYEISQMLGFYVAKLWRCFLGIGRIWPFKNENWSLGKFLVLTISLFKNNLSTVIQRVSERSTQ